MNAAAVSLLERPYAEVVADILTAVVGGVVNEPIYFDLKQTLYKLAQPAAAVRSLVGLLRGTVAGQSTVTRYSFQQDVDYAFSAADNAIVWLGAAQPDDESTFYVDYVRVDSSSPLSDVNVGSVTRTLSEAIGREIATVYQQIGLAYAGGFVDTATGQALDLVVAILGVTRKTKEYAAGLVTFFRDPAAGSGSITIPPGTALSSAKGEAGFVTAELRTLQAGQVRIDLPVRADDASKGPAGVVGANTITVLAAPIIGISRVTNFDPTVLGAADESDEALRARAKAVLQGTGKATIAALARAVFDEHATLDEIRDPNSAPPKGSDPGTVLLLVSTPPERFVSLQSAVQQTRAAGVLATLVARYVFFKPKLRATPAAPLSAAGKVKLVGQIIAAMQHYVDGLSEGTAARADDLLHAIAAAVEELADPKQLRYADAMTWYADVGSKASDPLVDALVTAVEATAPGDPAALRAAVAAVVAQTAAPVFSDERVPDRGLVRGPGGARATDVEIEAGTFSIVPLVNGESNWTIVLDVDPADIVLVAG